MATRPKVGVDDVLVAKNSFVAHVDGVPVLVRKGETFRVGHPVIEGREVFFDVHGIDNDWTEADAAKREKMLAAAAAKTAELEATKAEAAKDVEVEDEDEADES